jgi:aspartate-semialdehyde dehydrogenase
MISTSEIRVSVICRDTDLDAAVRAVHDAFDLGGDEEAVVYAGDGKMNRLPSLRVVGATGRRRHRCCANCSRRGATSGARCGWSRRGVRPGRRIMVRGEELEVQELSPGVFDGIDVAMFDVPDEVAADWAPIAVKHGAVAVDNSTAFRLDRDVPLVVPEINPEQVRNRPRGIIASANCTTVAMIVAIAPLHYEYGLRELVLASYQSVSGVGKAGVDALLDQLDRVGGDRSLGSRSGNVRRAVGDDLGPFPAPMALNVVPWAGGLRDAGWSSEELKLRNETRKILGLPDLKVSATCVRVPVVTGHSVAGARGVRRGGRRRGRPRGAAARARRDPRRRSGVGRVPDADRRGGHRPVLGRPHPALARRPAGARLLRHRRQPAQGRGAEHRADRRAAGGGAS